MPEHTIRQVCAAYAVLVFLILLLNHAVRMGRLTAAVESSRFKVLWLVLIATAAIIYTAVGIYCSMLL